MYQHGTEKQRYSSPKLVGVIIKMLEMCSGIKLIVKSKKMKARSIPLKITFFNVSLTLLLLTTLKKDLFKRTNTCCYAKQISF